MLYRWLALLVVVAHFGFFLYLLTGGYLAWRWPRTIALHVVTVAWAASTLVTGLACPLTRLQNSLREQGGQHPLADTFMNTYLRGAFYPAGHEGLTRLVVGLLIGVSWAGFAFRLHAWRSSAARASGRV
jgi:hypothetical protein